jgi:DNA replication protein DnaC
LIGDVPAATAILDRFLHHAEVIEIQGQSYRMKDRGQTKKKPSQSETTKSK